MIYHIEMWVEYEPDPQLDLFGHHAKVEKYCIFLPADSEEDVERHYREVHKRDDIRYEILEVYGGWEEARNKNT